MPHHLVLDPFPLVYTGRLVEADVERGIVLLLQVRGTSRGRQTVYIETRVPRHAGLEWFCDYADARSFLGLLAQYRWTGNSAAPATLIFEPSARRE